MQCANFSRRHFDLAFANYLQRQTEIESRNGAAIFPFRAEAQIPGQDYNWGIESFRVSSFATMSGCQDCLAVVFEKLRRMHHAIDRGFDPQSVLLIPISGREDLTRQCHGLGLSLARQGVLPGSAVYGWYWPFG